MTQGTVSLPVRRLSDTVSVVGVNGELTAGCEQALMDAYARATDSETQVVMLDFSGLEYMNSGGIGLLVTLLVRANRDDRRLLAIGLDAHYRQIFELTRLDQAITIHASEADALAAAGP